MQGLVCYFLIPFFFFRIYLLALISSPSPLPSLLARTAPPPSSSSVKDANLLHAVLPRLSSASVKDALRFVTSKEACCGQGPYNGIGLCTPLSNLCPNRDLYVFWDPFHPSERANRILMQTIMTGDNKFMYPMNLSSILALDSRA